MMTPDDSLSKENAMKTNIKKVDDYDDVGFGEFGYYQTGTGLYFSHFPANEHPFEEGKTYLDYPSARFYLNDEFKVLHRLGGPAVIYYSGVKKFFEYWVNGVQYTLDEYNNILNLPVNVVLLKRIRL